MVSFLASSPLVTKEHLASLREVNINLAAIMTIVVIINNLEIMMMVSSIMMIQLRYIESVSFLVATHDNSRLVRPSCTVTI